MIHPCFRKMIAKSMHYKEPKLIRELPLVMLSQSSCDMRQKILFESVHKNEYTDDDCLTRKEFLLLKNVK